MPMSLPCAAMAPAIEVPCGCGVSLPASASKLFTTAPSRSGCLASISESITATSDVFSGRDLMRLRDLQLGQNILSGIARAGGSGRRGFRGVFLQREQIIRLHGGDDVFGTERLHDARHAAAAADAPAIKAGADQREVLRFELAQDCVRWANWAMACGVVPGAKDVTISSGTNGALPCAAAPPPPLLPPPAARAAAPPTMPPPTMPPPTAPPPTRSERCRVGQPRRPGGGGPANPPPRSGGETPPDRAAHHRPAETAHAAEAESRCRMRSADTARQQHHAAEEGPQQSSANSRLRIRNAVSHGKLPMLRCSSEAAREGQSLVGYLTRSVRPVISVCRGDEADDLVVLQRVDDARAGRLARAWSARRAPG